MAGKSKRNDGRYQVTISLGRDSETGKRLQKYFYGKTQKEARAKRDEWIEQQKKAQTVEHVDDGSVSAWVEKWLSIYANSAGYSSRQTQENCASKVKKTIGGMQISAVRKSDIQYLANSFNEYSFSMVRKLSSFTRRLFADALADRLIMLNPCDGVKWDYASKGSHRALEEWERNLIVSNWNQTRAGIWAMLMLFAGLRRGEALALKWEDIDENYIHIRRAVHFEGGKSVINNTPKTLAGVRDIPILPPLRTVLTGEHSPDEFVCKNAAGLQIQSESSFLAGWKSFINSLSCALNGITNYKAGFRSDLIEKSEMKVFECRPHDLRHTFCTMLFEADVDLKTAQTLMGHADSEMTLKVYTHLSALKQKTSYDKLSNYLKKYKN